MIDDKIECLTIEMPDGIWAVPISVIARNRATYYADEFGGDIEKSLAEDTLPLFEEHPYEIHDWSGNNMDWKDVEKYAVLLPTVTFVGNRQEYWMNNQKDILPIDACFFDCIA